METTFIEYFKTTALLTIVLSLATPLGAQDRADHRLRVMTGGGQASVLPGITSEAGSSWMINSLVAGSGDKDETAAAIPLNEAGEFHAGSAYISVDYTFIDRLQFQYEYGELTRNFDRNKSPGLGLSLGPNYKNNATYVDDINKNFDRNGSAAVNFLALSNDRNDQTFFEGLRLAKYTERQNDVQLAYLHPLFRGLNAGVFAGYEWYQEINEVNFGSYVSKKSAATDAPSSTNFVHTANIPVIYYMTGPRVGPALRYQMYEWFGLYYQASPIIRSGTMSAFGAGAIRQDASTLTGIDPLYYLAAADVKDRGARQKLTAEFTFLCRFHVQIGLLREDIQRSYSGYIGDAIAEEKYAYQSKTAGIGWGEMSSSHRITKSEASVKIGASVFF